MSLNTRLDTLRIWKVSPQNFGEINALKKVATEAMRQRNTLYGDNPEFLRLAIESRFARALLCGEVWTAELKCVCLIVYPSKTRVGMSGSEDKAVREMLQLEDQYNKELERIRPGWKVSVPFSAKEEKLFATWSSYPMSTMLATNPSSRGEGLATFLCYAIEVVLSKSHTGISLRTDSTQLAAAYAQGGFKTVLTQELMDERGNMEWIMMTKMFDRAKL